MHKLRPMVESDLEQVLQWRNHPEIRRYMYTTHEIDLDEHRKWFFDASTNSATELLIYEWDNSAHGFVNISRTRCQEVANWGFYLNPGAPKGSGREMGKQALNHAFFHMKLHKLCGQAVGFNDRSISFHKRLGFAEEGRLREQHCNGSQFYDVVCFGLLDHEWQAQVKD